MTRRRYQAGAASRRGARLAPRRPASGVAAVTATPAKPDGQSAMVRSSARDWGAPLVLIGLAAIVFAVAFHRDIAGAVRVWIDSTAYNHCFLVPALIAYLLWERRAAFATLLPRPCWWPLLLIPPVSAVWLLAAVLDLQEGRQFALVAMFQLVLLAVLGPRVVRTLLAPVLFLFFLVPSGGFLVPWLQNVTAHITVIGLQALHIPVYSDGYMIDIPEGTFEIAEACAGLRFLIASIVFGCFFAVVMYRSFFRRAVFIALSVAVPIGANGLRALGIVLLAHIEGSAAAVEADHVLYGWLFFSLVILALIAIGVSFTDKGERAIPAPQGPVRAVSAWRFAPPAVAAILLAVSGPAYAARLAGLYPAAAFSASAAPEVSSPWRLLPGAPAWRPLVEGADREFIEGFEEPGSGVVIRYVGLYRLAAIGNRLTRSENRIADGNQWQLVQRGRAQVTLNGERAAVASDIITRGGRRRLVWSFFVVDGKVVSGLLQAKLLQARAVLLRQAPLAALVAVSASMDDPDNPADKQLRDFLAASQPLAEYLASLRPRPGV
jgi:exosortase A